MKANIDVYSYKQKYKIKLICDIFEFPIRHNSRISENLSSMYK